MYISDSVGENGKNDVNDVKFVQEILNMIASKDAHMPTLTVDGKAGKKTSDAINKLQRIYVKLKTPDNRIDPNGRSEKTLVANALAIDKASLAELVKKHQRKEVSPAVHQKGPKTITYRVHARRVLSTYTENIVKLAMTYAGINKCDISSTIRTFDDQARIMYENCFAYRAASSVESLRAARGWGYAAPGKEVEKVYYSKKTAGKEATTAAMKSKIEELYRQGQQVSLHCVSQSDYFRKNVLDIPYNSVDGNKRKDLEVALMGMAQEVKNARHAKPIPGEPYVSRLIIEDKCWHLEIDQTHKQLPNQARSAIGDFTCGTFICALDQWF
ncbi:hypothetical protein WMF27_46730 [Sorangium sp. So ce281]|uniref:hypothetical protein n=1 Tax=unclassified Sorangium TaxID=2621164 RepID=UPI003F62C580